jgi:hypothetical protein
MKKYAYLSSSFFIVTFALTILLGYQTSSIASPTSAASTSTSANADSGRLVIRRVANLGNLSVLDVKIDGKRVASVAHGQTYDAALPAGPHVITVALGADNRSAAPAEKRITIQKGQTYIFTATYKQGVVVLQ